MNRRVLLVLAVLGGAFFCGLHALTVRAQTNSQGFSVITSPLPVDLVATPGQTVSTDLRIKNTALNTERIQAGLMKFGATGTNGTPTLSDRGPQDSYFDWVSFSPKVFDAPSNVWMDVKMTIKVPKTAGLGYYLAATFSPASEQVGSSQNHLIGSTATLVLLEVKVPGEKRQLQLDSFTADHNLYQYLPTDFAINVQNIGNIHVVPSGTLFINRGSQSVAKININAVGGNVLPSTHRVFTADWSDGFPVYVDKQVDGKPVYAKSGEPKRTLSWNFSKASRLRFGHYTASLYLVYNDGTNDVPLQAVTSFWVIPWIPLLVLLVIIVFVGVGLFTIGRAIWRKFRK